MIYFLFRLFLLYLFFTVLFGVLRFVFALYAARRRRGKKQQSVGKRFFDGKEVIDAEFKEIDPPSGDKPLK